MDTNVSRYLVGLVAWFYDFFLLLSPATSILLLLMKAIFTDGFIAQLHSAKVMHILYGIGRFLVPSKNDGDIHHGNVSARRLQEGLFQESFKRLKPPSLTVRSALDISAVYQVQANFCIDIIHIFTTWNPFSGPL